MGSYEAMTVDLPEGSHGSVELRRITVTRGTGFREALRGRGTAPGDYTGLYRNGRLWMSDTDAEKRDHLEPLQEIRRVGAKRVLINGLGLGMVLRAALALDHVEHVDVVEIDEDVIALVGQHYSDPRVHIRHGDAYEVAATGWPPRTHWDVAWHDIWPNICTDNLPGMQRLHRSYGRRTGWQGSWSHEMVLYHRRKEQAEERRYRAFWD